MAKTSSVKVFLYTLFLQSFSLTAGMVSFVAISTILLISSEKSISDLPFAYTINVSLVIALGVSILQSAYVIRNSSEEYEDKLEISINDIKNLLSSHSESVNSIVKAESEAYRDWYKSTQKTRFKIVPIDPGDLDSSYAATLRSSDIVKNTFVNLNRISGPNTADGESTLNFYIEHLSSGRHKTWIDVAGTDDFLGGRYQKLSLKDPSSSGLHEINIISDSIPIINFSLFGNGGSLTDVYFGWLSNDNTLGNVYHSRDERLVALFNQYFELLKDKRKDKIVVDYNKALDRRFAGAVSNNIRGTWFSVSVLGGKRRPDDYTEYSIIQIYVDEGVWRFRGRTFERRSEQVIHDLEGISVSMFESGVFYRFRRINTANRLKTEGHGTYELMALKANMADGAYVSLADRADPIHRTRAIKINDDPHMDIERLPARETDLLIQQIYDSIKESKA